MPPTGNYIVSFLHTAYYNLFIFIRTYSHYFFSYFYITLFLSSGSFFFFFFSSSTLRPFPYSPFLSHPLTLGSCTFPPLSSLFSSTCSFATFFLNCGPNASFTLPFLLSVNQSKSRYPFYFFRFSVFHPFYKYFGLSLSSRIYLNSLAYFDSLISAAISCIQLSLPTLSIFFHVSSPFSLLLSYSRSNHPLISRNSSLSLFAFVSLLFKCISCTHPFLTTPFQLLFKFYCPYCHFY